MNNIFVAEIGNKLLALVLLQIRATLTSCMSIKIFRVRDSDKLLKTLEQVADKFNVKEIWAEVSITAGCSLQSKGFEITKSIQKVGDVKFEDTMTKVSLLPFTIPGRRLGNNIILFI
jgi:hypothetical protein